MEKTERKTVNVHFTESRFLEMHRLLKAPGIIYRILHCSWMRMGGGSLGEHGAGGVRETGEKRQKRAGSGISTRDEAGEKLKKESVCYFLLLMIHSKT